MPVHIAVLHVATRILAVMALAVAANAHAQSDYPNRPVRIIVPFGAGGLSDNLTRLFAKELSERLGQPFVPDFRPGASTNIGAAALAASPPDGHTLFVATIASNALNKWTYKKLPYDPDGFVNVGMLAVNTFYVVVRPESPFQTVQDLVRAARESPKGLSYGSHGNGGANHMITELFRTRAGIRDLLHVAYKGPESHVDLMAGRTDFMIDGAAINHVQAGKLRALAVAFPKRWPTQPNVPTMAEAGYPDVTISTFFGLSAPAGTPAAVADKLNAALRAIASHPEMDKRLLAMNMMPMSMSRTEMNDFIRAQSDKWGPVLRSLNIVFE
ncbi:MAG: tripartite tricarboxylate transporter substrate binding protein [Burkholderiales bacterium]|nr:tripartite tricarboxylate transporter substrate binding protein [Burkholderiales bacterium]